MPAPRSVRVATALLLGALSGPALALDPARAITQYHLDTWQRRQGLPSNGVLALQQTRDGYLWIGTYGGLVRFDGVRFRVFDRSNTPALRSSSAWRLLEARDGTLWVGTNGGGLVSYRDGVFRAYTAHDGLTGDVVTGLGESAGGVLWVGTRTGLDRVVPGPDRLAVTHVLDEERKPVAAPYAFSAPPGGPVHAGTPEALYEIDPSVPRPIARRRKVVAGPVWALSRDRSGTLWVGTASGLLSIGPSGERRYSRKDGLPVDVVTALREDQQGNLWIGTDGAGLVRYRDGRFETFGEAQGLTSSRIAALATDREGSLWVGTSRAGLNRLKDGKLVNLTASEGLPSELVWQVAEDRDGSLLLCTSNGLVRVRDGKVSEPYVPSPSDGLVRAVLRDRTGQLWMGTRAAGLVKVPDGERLGAAASFGTAEGLPSNHVRALAEDAGGRLWIGTAAGLCVKEGRTIRTLGPADGLPALPVLGLLAARDGELWIATDGAGLGRLEAGRFRLFSVADGLPSDVVLGLHEDGHGAIWVATNGGLARFAGGRFSTFGRAQGLLSDQVSQVLADGQGGLWVGSNIGVCRVPLGDLEAVAAGRASAVTPFALGLPDGMRSDECNVPAVPLRSRSGSLLFPTTRGIAVVDPARLPRNTLAPPVAVEEVVVAGQPRPAVAPVVLAPSERSFEVRYTALSLLAPERVRFRYRLEGFDRDWVDAGTRRVAYYTAVPPGAYRFDVLACNDDGVWTTEPAGADLVVRPAPWQTWWARLLAAALGVAAVGAAVRVRVRLLERRTRALEAEVDLRTRDLVEKSALLEHERTALEAANVRLHELDRIKADFTAMLVHDLKAPLTVVTAAVKILKGGVETSPGQREQLLDSSERNLDRMLGLVNETLEVFRTEGEEIELRRAPLDPEPLLREVARSARIVAGERGLAFAADVAHPLPRIDADAEKLTRVLENLLSNAIKFSRPGGTVTLEARAAPGTGVEAGLTLLVVGVTDTGEGIPPDEVPYVFNPYRQGKRRKGGVGLGLSIVKRIVAAHGGNVTVRSQLGVGTSFLVVLPTVP